MTGENQIRPSFQTMCHVQLIKQARYGLKVLSANQIVADESNSTLA